MKLHIFSPTFSIEHSTIPSLNIHISYFASVGRHRVAWRRPKIFIFRRFANKERCRLEAAPAIPDRGRGLRGIRGDTPDQGG